MSGVRRPAVAGSFYPADQEHVLAALDRSFAQARPVTIDGPPKAIVVPHAGWMYSGPIAATAYATLADVAHAIRRVVLVGPSHRVPFRGIAVSGASGFSTPLGVVPVDDGLRAIAAEQPAVFVDDRPHAYEHSLEVQVPFLQVALDEFTLLPVATGWAEAEEVAGLLAAVWGGPETLVVISTDLSHYDDYATAQRRDEHTATAIVNLDADAIDDHDACGAVGLRGLLVATRRMGGRVVRLDLRNSGDTEGDRDRVVGYGAFALAGA